MKDLANKINNDWKEIKNESISYKCIHNIKNEFGNLNLEEKM